MFEIYVRYCCHDFGLKLLWFPSFWVPVKNSTCLTLSSQHTMREIALWILQIKFYFWILFNCCQMSYESLWLELVWSKSISKYAFCQKRVRDWEGNLQKRFVFYWTWVKLRSHISKEQVLAKFFLAQNHIVNIFSFVDHQTFFTTTQRRVKVYVNG